MDRFELTRRSFSAGLAGTAVAAFGGMIGLAGCSGGESAGSGSAAASGTFRIGVLQLTQHAALDQANEGFIAALDDSGIAYDADQQNASNDQNACQTIAQTFANDGCDLILAIATPAAQAALGATSDIPIIGTAITDFAASGLVDSNDAPGGNLTGTSDMNPVADQIALLQQLVPNAANVGLLFCTAESNSEIQSVVEAMVNQVDVVYTPTDNTIASAMTQIASIANEAGVPTICGEVGQVEAGGLASVSINYYELGYRAGEMAVQILAEGADPAEMPVETMTADECDLVYNQATADEIGVDVSALADEGGEDVSAA
ncbi:ABC transporter substrate-binding protein [Enorma burkinafasonensis]|uniref:ABC transporter substrate-binding protein n=1 Tax=Enorma burkinafasonensis TaxID=2590867 RepID=UPI0026F31D91|nr:ABC transporter substrate-binding protein [Enorma burkinafasonensis]MCI7730672.1 ABC transporter substrate-binding protein [Enorma burkinafasonensis]